MEILILTVAVVITAIIVTYFLTRNKNIEDRLVKYEYFAKKQIMTNAEKVFYERLINEVGDMYYVVPQAHLSMFIDHRTKGQHWKAAFSVINGKSVDFLIVEKTNQKPVLAIELDDFTHQREDRIRRDQIVEEILNRAGMPIERYSSSEQVPALMNIRN